MLFREKHSEAEDKRQRVLTLTDSELANISDDELEDLFNHLKPREMKQVKARAEILVEKKNFVKTIIASDIANMSPEEFADLESVLNDADKATLRYFCHFPYIFCEV